jgi:uncharacterized membrane protein YozB (DUF420 family)
MSKSTNKNIISAILGFLGAANSLVIGFYLISTMLSISQIQSTTSQSAIASIAIGITFTSLTCGSFEILKGNTKKGARINMAGGIFFILVYIYYSEFSQPSFLGWLNPIGITLLIPPLLSGTIGLLYDLKN